MKQLAKICIYYSSTEFKNLTQVYGIQLSYAGNLANASRLQSIQNLVKWFQINQPSLCCLKVHL